MCLTFYLLWLLLPCLVVAVILILCHGHGVSYRERFTLKYTVCCFWPWMYCLIVTVIYWLYFIFLTISSSHIFDSLIMSSIMSSQDHELDIGVDYVCVCQVCVCVWCVCLHNVCVSQTDSGFRHWLTCRRNSSVLCFVPAHCIIHWYHNTTYYEGSLWDISYTLIYILCRFICIHWHIPVHTHCIQVHRPVLTNAQTYAESSLSMLVCWSIMQ